MNYDSKRWIFLILCILMNACAGILYAWSVFQKPLVALTKATPAEVSLSFTFMLSLGAFLPIIVGKALDYVQPRVVLVSGGVLLGGGLIGLSCVESLMQLYIFATLTGFGIAVVYPGGTVSNMVQFFPDKRGLAAGLLTAGASLGAIAWAPAAVFLIEEYGVLSTFKWIGMTIFVVICAAGALIEKVPKDYRPEGMVIPRGSQQTAAGNAVDMNWVEMLKSPLFYLVAGVFLGGAISGMMIIGYVSPIAQDILNLTPQAAAGVVALLAVANTTGRFCWGWLSDKIGRFAVMYILLTLGVLAMTGLSMASAYVIFVGLVMLIGLCYGGFLALMAPFTAELFGAKNLGVNFGIMFLTVGLGAFVGPRLAAVIKATNNDYTQAFIIAALFNVTGIVLITAAHFYKKRRQ